MGAEWGVDGVRMGYGQRPCQTWQAVTRGMRNYTPYSPSYTPALRNRSGIAQHLCRSRVEPQCFQNCVRIIAR